MFTDDGQLYYPSEPEEEGQPDPSILPEFFGDFIVVNGSPWPFLEVEPRKYRFRLLNGSDSRFYTLSMSSGPQPVQIGGDAGLYPGGGPFTFFQIGSDGGLLPAPVPLNKLTLGPGERADVVVDFSHPGLWGKTIVIRNNAKTPFPMGEAVDPRTVGKIMAFRVTKPLNGTDTSDLPATLRPPITPPGPVDTTRQLLLFEGVDEYGRLRPQLGTATGGVLLWHDPITENPHLNDVEVWEIYNASEDAHPIHLHLVQFQVLSRQRFTADVVPFTGALSDIQLIGRPTEPNANEVGFKDTVQMFPGQVTRIIAKFDLPGLYVWHCHILSHEDHEMMRPYEVVSEAAPAPSASAEAALVTAFTEAGLNAIATSKDIGQPLNVPRPVAVVDRSTKTAADGVFDRESPSIISTTQSHRRVSDLVFAAFKQRPLDELSLISESWGMQ
jgi:spore coat protein A